MRVSVLNVPIDLLERDELEATLLHWLDAQEQKTIATPNPEMLLCAQRDSHFAHALDQTHLLLPDAIGIRYAILALGLHHAPPRHTGVDTLHHLAQLLADRGQSILIFGGEGDRAVLAAGKLMSMYPKLIAWGYNAGKLERKDGILLLSHEVKEHIRERNPSVIALALPHEKQVAFFSLLSEFPSVRIAIGVGGAVDMLSDALPRAPIWMQHMGLEWLWRLGLEPRRAKRIFNAAVIFPLIIAKETLKKHQFTAALHRVLPDVWRRLSGKNL